jgi:disulfide bond formation protein DsbB
MMSRNLQIILAAGGSAALLFGAFGFEYIGGLLPCQLCLWQRWPHALAVLLGVLALAVPYRIWPILAGIAALSTAAIGIFHFGVEQTWWEGLASCTVDAMANVSLDDLLNTQITVGAPVRCDAIAWEFLGISMAGWNAILSLGLAGLWLRIAQKAA